MWLIIPSPGDAIPPCYRYPPQLEKNSRSQTNKLGIIPRSDLEYALKSMQSFADISEQELVSIYQKAKQHNIAQQLSTDDIKLGHYYIHGQSEDQGVIHRIIDESDSDAADNNMVIYKVITGPERKQTASISREAFAQWARHEVIFENDKWVIKDHDD